MKGIQLDKLLFLTKKLLGNNMKVETIKNSIMESQTCNLHEQGYVTYLPWRTIAYLRMRSEWTPPETSLLSEAPQSLVSSK